MGLTISCDTCERIWTMATSFTLHEQQAMESCPCPHCGAYTITCHEPDWQENAAKTHRSKAITF